MIRILWTFFMQLSSIKWQIKTYLPSQILLRLPVDLESQIYWHSLTPVHMYGAVITVIACGGTIH